MRSCVTLALLFLLHACAAAAGAEIADLPGAPPFDPDTRQRIAAALKPPAGTAAHAYTNRLILENNPYLLQHAHNPVNWYAWGDEAFKAAQVLGRPILLSIGYSTCHWCHVMEQESFQDLEIAAYMNANYVAIKVDREQRPDIDAVYLKAVQGISGEGGWPMTVWLTPEGKPFFGGTYYTPLGFLTWLKRISETYAKKRNQVQASAEHLTRLLNALPQPAKTETTVGRAALDRTVKHVLEHYDSQHGGMKGTPKFPADIPYRLLLRYARRTQDTALQSKLEFSLHAMARGGIYDHLGGGFHRYAVDESWSLPHFEKMLPDNALLSRIYLEAWLATGNSEHKRIVVETLQSLSRDFKSPDGAFYSACDADSAAPGQSSSEGAFYLWSAAEIDRVLTAELSRAFKVHFRISGSGTLQAASAQTPPDPALIQAKEQLFQHRELRPKPDRDEKVIAGWNGLAISAFAQAGFYLGEPEYIRTAVRAAEFTLQKLVVAGRLNRSYFRGAAQGPAYLEDYAYLTAAFLDLYEATGDLAWYKQAIGFDRILNEEFADSADGGYFTASSRQEQLIAREKPIIDSALPSGNSVAALNSLRIHAFTGSAEHRQRAERIFHLVLPELGEAPWYAAELLVAADFMLDKPREIAVIHPPGATPEPFLAVLRSIYLPVKVVALAQDGAEPNLPLLEGKSAVQGKTTAYVCRNRICKLPETDPENFKKLLAPIEPY